MVLFGQRKRPIRAARRVAFTTEAQSLYASVVFTASPSRRRSPGNQHYCAIVRSTVRELLAGGCLLLGGWWVLSGVRSFVLGLLSRRWPKANGVIRKAKVVTSRNSEGDELTWQELEYSYSVSGRRYRGRVCAWVCRAESRRPVSRCGAGARVSPCTTVARVQL
jgi:hypothetical protein